MSLEGLRDTLLTGAELLLAANVVYSVGTLAVDARRFRQPGFVEQTYDFPPEQADQLLGFADSAVDYIRQEGIGAVALMDMSARPFYIPLRAAWANHSETAGEQPPSVFFVNPQGFQPGGMSALSKRYRTTRNAIKKGDPLELKRSPRSRSAMADAMPQELPGLYAHRDEPVLLFDTCLHKGDAAIPVLDVMRAAGFSDVRFMVTHHDTDWKAPLTPDVVLHGDGMPKGGCYPFGMERAVSKTYASSYSRVMRAPRRVAQGRQLRLQLRGAMSDAIDRRSKESGQIA